MTRILMLPHAAATSLRTRSGELARALAGLGHEVDLFTRLLQPQGLSRAGRWGWHIGRLLPEVRRKPIQKGLSTVSAPSLARPLALGLFVDRLAAQLLMPGHDTVISAAYDGPSPLQAASLLRPKRFIYDLVDDHGAGWRHAGDEATAQRVEKYVARQMRAADEVIASSHVLVELARERFGREARLVPNGADVLATRAHQAAPPRDPVVGYVGGLDRFVRIDLVVNAIARLRAKGIPARLKVVGDGPAIRGFKIPDWVELLGFRPPAEIPKHLAGFSVGIVPFELSPFTDAALPLKVLEYGAARRLCVSAPLAELKRHSFPWVSYAGLDENEWESALEKALERAGTWSTTEWDPIVDRYDWRVAAQKAIQPA